MDMRLLATATTTSPEHRVQTQSFSDAKGAEGGALARLPPRAKHPSRTEVEILPDVVRGGTNVYPSVQGGYTSLASMSTKSPTEYSCRELT